MQFSDYHYQFVKKSAHENTNIVSYIIIRK